mgnify:CR=1 FL=1
MSAQNDVSRAQGAAPALLGLEVMRFVCALSVLLWHYQQFYVVGPVHADMVHDHGGQPWASWLAPFYGHGWLGVQAFWALSGFIFFWKYGQAVADGWVAAGRFAWLRFSRLYPLHLLTLLAMLPLIAWYRAQTGGQDYVYPHNTVENFVLQLFLASDWAGRNEWSFNGPIWSISIEVLAYAVFFALSRLGWVRPWQIGAVIGATGVVYALKLTPHPLVLCLFFFYLGGLTHAGWRWLQASTPKLRGLAQAVRVNGGIEVCGPFPPLHFDEGHGAAPPDDQVHLAARGLHAAGQHPPALQPQEPRREPFAAPPLRLADRARFHFSSIARA